MSSALSSQDSKIVSFPVNLAAMEPLAEWIRKQLATSGRSAADLARFCNVSRANITHWTNPDKRVNLRAENLHALALFFGVDVEEVPGPLFKPLNQRSAPRRIGPNNPFPNADAAMLAELSELAMALPVTRKARLLDLARQETKAYADEIRHSSALEKQ